MGPFFASARKWGTYQSANEDNLLQLRGALPAGQHHVTCHVMRWMHIFMVRPSLGNANSGWIFSGQSFFWTLLWGHGRPRLQIMDVRAEMLVVPRFRGFDRSFCSQTSARISAWTSTGYRLQNSLFGLIFRSWIVLCDNVWPTTVAKQINVKLNPPFGRLIFTTTGAGASGHSTSKYQYWQ